MSGAQLAAAAGLLVALGLVLVVGALRPAPPALGAALAQLSAAPLAVAAVRVAPSTRERWRWLPLRAARLLDAHVGVAEADLQILGLTRAALVARKCTYAVAGLAAPAVLGLLGLLLRAPTLVVVPAGMAVALAAVGWLLPSQEARERAVVARVEFRSALAVYLALVAGERRARGSVEQALEEAAEVSGSVPFLRLRRAVRTAALAGRKPWQDLRDLGEELGVPELRSCADIAAVAADGASVYGSLLASARTLRHAELSDARAEANQVSERMARPLSLLVLGLTTFVLVPFVLRLVGGG